MAPARLMVSTTVNARRSAVYAALTDHEALASWFAERVETQPDAGCFRTDGSFTPRWASGALRTIDAQPGRRLALCWEAGAGSPVEIELVSVPTGRTGVRFVQWSPPGGGPDDPSALDFWCLAAGNLANHLEGRPVVRHDFARPRRGTARAEATLAVPARRVYAALTVPAELERWIAATAVVSPRVGGRYDFGWGDDLGPRSIVDLEPSRSLAYTWRERGHRDSVVRWTLRPCGRGTTVRVQHDLGGRPADRHQIGWENFLIDLQRMLASGQDWQRSVWQDEPVG
ncbi:SRPBCC family protein [Micromonospora aurantiaca]|uniref:SRPBCC family protein n=1 Tax=Micromonospora aurantiaca (nom. illeg.) TaxID=47850 RepID=UPI002E17A971